MTQTSFPKPTLKPANPSFSCGPCAKRPGWALAQLNQDTVGRSHRAGVSKEQLKDVIDRTRATLNIPDDYYIGIAPGSETGAMEIAMWNLLGVTGMGVDVLAWEHFSLMWLDDIQHELKIKDVRNFTAPFGQLPDMSQLDGDRDLVFAWNGTTSGVCVPEDWRPLAGKGLKICDATSAVFAYDLPWRDLDVITWPWQKGMGSEAQHGMMVFSPRALERLQNYTPTWPIPKIFQLKDAKGVKMDFFKGITINTPSMLCVADALDALQWIADIGNAPATMERVKRNAQAMDELVASRPYLTYAAADSSYRSRTSICLRFCAPEFEALADEQKVTVVNKIVALLEQEQAAYDVRSYSTAPLGLRIWCGTTVETANIMALGPWIDWAYSEIMASV
jgi:phosphoserine aminotransferase